MSNIRDYMKTREKQKKESHKINYKEKIRGHKLTIFYRTALAVFLVVALVLLFYIQWKNKIYVESSILSSVDLVTLQGTEVRSFGSNILQYSKDGASCLDIDGNTLWNQPYEMQNPIVAVCRNIVAIGDYNGSVIYVMDDQKKLGEIPTNLPIRYFDVAANGLVITVLDDGDVTWIYLYTPTGDAISHIRTSMDKSGYPVSVTISPDGKLVGVSYLYVDSGEMKTSIAFYNFGPVGQNENLYMSGYNYLNTIVPTLQFMNGESAFGVSDDRIMFFEGNEKPLSIQDILLSEKIQSVYFSEEYVGLVFNNISGETAYRLDIYDRRGTLLLSKNFDFDYSEIVFTNDSFIIYNDLECMICNINGTEKYNGPLEKTTALLIPTASQGRFVAVTSDSVDLLEFN